MIRMYKKTYFQDQRPIWMPLVDENGRPVLAASIEEAAQLVAAMRGEVYHLRHGEYAAPDYGIKWPDGRIRPVDPWFHGEAR